MKKAGHAPPRTHFTAFLGYLYTYLLVYSNIFFIFTSIHDFNDSRYINLNTMVRGITTPLSRSASVVSGYQMAASMACNPRYGFFTRLHHLSRDAANICCSISFQLVDLPLTFYWVSRWFVHLLRELRSSDGTLTSGLAGSPTHRDTRLEWWEF